MKYDDNHDCGMTPWTTRVWCCHLFRSLVGYIILCYCCYNHDLFLSLSVNILHDLPVCVLVCLLRSNVSLNPFPQNVQRNLFTSLWHLRCLFN